jgi:NADH:ubiquinone oxidoreductase subunit K
MTTQTTRAVPTVDPGASSPGRSPSRKIALWAACSTLAGVMCVLAVVTLHGDLTGATSAQASEVGVTSEALVAMCQATFLLGPGIMPAINALFLGYVLYRSGLVPRILPTIGLIGAPLLLTTTTTVTLFGGWSQMSSVATLFALPIAAWEFSIGVYMTVKGFRRTPVTDAVDAEPIPAVQAA